MPILNLDDDIKRIIAPSTADTPEDQAWVEMATYPLCADDYTTYNNAMYLHKMVKEAKLPSDPTPLPPEPALNPHILARRIKQWNYTDKTGVVLQIDAKACSRLLYPDQIFFLNQIQDDAPPLVGDEEKKTSLATSSQSTTATP